ncbi:partner of sld5 [Anaeramoeba flamelloides]|uniref:Partner of sld5 n=1 Tax=Anaeramoeba flamelloides TaxID=1746091 RepID=A0ABQ8XWE8_9EUKA|nr:partner of sld5 [Anaeramoeba flamelloides]
MDQSGVNLIKELTNSSMTLPFYNQELVDKVKDQVLKHQDTLNEILSEQDPRSPEISSALLFYHFSMQRNKRYLCVYHNERIKKLKKLCWVNGAVLPKNFSPRCSENEKNFYNEYSTILARFICDLSIDLTTFNDPPSNVSTPSIDELLRKQEQILFPQVPIRNPNELESQLEIQMGSGTGNEKEIEKEEEMEKKNIVENKKVPESVIQPQQETTKEVPEDQKDQEKQEILPQTQIMTNQENNLLQQMKNENKPIIENNQKEQLQQQEQENQNNSKTEILQEKDSLIQIENENENEQVQEKEKEIEINNNQQSENQNQQLREFQQETLIKDQEETVGSMEIETETGTQTENENENENENKKQKEQENGTSKENESVIKENIGNVPQTNEQNIVISKENQQDQKEHATQGKEETHTQVQPNTRNEEKQNIASELNPNENNVEKNVTEQALITNKTQSTQQLKQPEIETKKELTQQTIIQTEIQTETNIKSELLQKTKQEDQKQEYLIVQSQNNNLVDQQINNPENIPQNIQEQVLTTGNLNKPSLTLDETVNNTYSQNTMEIEKISTEQQTQNDSEQN